MLRTILNSRTYQADFRPNDFNKDDVKYFSHYQPRLLFAEQLLDAICAVTALPEKFAGLPAGTKATQLPAPDLAKHEFLKIFGQPERQTVCQCERSSDSNLGMAIQFFNGPLIYGKLRDANNRFRKLLARRQAERRDHHRAVPGRRLPPADGQGAGSQPRPPRRQGDQIVALEDIAWAILEHQRVLVPALDVMLTSSGTYGVRCYSLLTIHYPLLTHFIGIGDGAARPRVAVAEERAMTRALAWGLWLFIVASFGVLLVDGTADEDGEGSAVAYTVFVVAFATTGALIASRRPRNPIGWILLGAGLAYSVGGMTIAAQDDGPPLVRWLSTWVWMAGIGPAATFGLLLFPDGRLPSRRWRAVAWLAARGEPVRDRRHRARAGPVRGQHGREPARAQRGAGRARQRSRTWERSRSPSRSSSSIASVAVRFRRSRGVERQQLKWLTYAGAAGRRGADGRGVDRDGGRRPRGEPDATRSSASRSRRCRSRWASRSCATACTTSTSSSTARWSTAR